MVVNTNAQHKDRLGTLFVDNASDNIADILYWLTAFVESQSKEIKDKRSLAMLATKISVGGDVDFTSEDIALIRKQADQLANVRIALMLNTLFGVAE
jgi:hypothetical protein